MISEWKLDLSEESDDGECENRMLRPESEDEFNGLIASAGEKPVVVYWCTYTKDGACRNRRRELVAKAKETDCNEVMIVDGDTNKIGYDWVKYGAWFPTMSAIVNGEAVDFTYDRWGFTDFVDKHKLDL